MQVQLKELRYGGGYRGVSMMSRPALFWPGLFPDSEGRSTSCYYSWIELLPQESLPPHKLYLKNLPFLKKLKVCLETLEGFSQKVKVYWETYWELYSFFATIEMDPFKLFKKS